MKLKEILIEFFKPEWKKIFLLFALEFLITFTLLFTSDSLVPAWETYILSPNILYLESTVNPMFIGTDKVSFQGAFSNLIAIVYLYFLSCLIIEGREFLKNTVLKIVRKVKA